MDEKNYIRKLPKHEAIYEEHLLIKCPKCKLYNQITWSDLEPGSKHTCGHCIYAWVVA